MQQHGDATAELTPENLSAHTQLAGLVPLQRIAFDAAPRASLASYADSICARR